MNKYILMAIFLLPISAYSETDFEQKLQKETCIGLRYDIRVAAETLQLHKTIVANNEKSYIEEKSFSIQEQKRQHLKQAEVAEIQSLQRLASWVQIYISIGCDEKYLMPFIYCPDRKPFCNWAYEIFSTSSPPSSVTSPQPLSPVN